MATWTELSDLPLNSIISTSLWNAIFGPDGNQAYLKEYADNITYELEKVYNADNVTIHCGWPQGLLTDSRGYEVFYDVGTVTFPKWFVAGFPSDNYLTLPGPAKYFAVLSVQFFPENRIAFSKLATFRIFITDTSGELNIQKTISAPQIRIETNDIYFQYSIPFIIDAPFDTDLMIGFSAQQRYDSVENINSPILFHLGDNTNLTFHKLPMLFSQTIPTTSFVLGTSVLDGTSAF